MYMRDITMHSSVLDGRSIAMEILALYFGNLAHWISVKLHLGQYVFKVDPQATQRHVRFCNRQSITNVHLSKRSITSNAEYRFYILDSRAQPSGQMYDADCVRDDWNFRKCVANSPATSTCS